MADYELFQNPETGEARLYLGDEHDLNGERTWVQLVGMVAQKTGFPVKNTLHSIEPAGDPDGGITFGLGNFYPSPEGVQRVEVQPYFSTAGSTVDLTIVSRAPGGDRRSYRYTTVEGVRASEFTDDRGKFVAIDFLSLAIPESHEVAVMAQNISNGDIADDLECHLGFTL